MNVQPRTKTARIDLRATPEEKAQLLREAHRLKLSLSDYILQKALS